jgi:broad specificity phosphatase PhoE
VTIFYLVRHAQKAVDDDLLVGRSPGIALSAHGRSQAEALAEHFRPIRVDRILSSPVQRALETAAPLASAKGLEVQTAEAISEFDFGQWTGLRQSALAGDQRWKTFNAFRSGTSTPGGETMLNLQARFVGEILRVHEVFPNSHVVFVSHGDPIRAALAYFLGIPLDLAQRIEISLASLSVIALSESDVRILKVNETV